ncbi:dentin sialophosphoprotein-like [Salvia hispanica]|uniref:dentin sialophosphoprotein-like n=1 Tax=Salvia hispanica TaxID=49212 RepID=UPI002009B9F0|nr:dentin sialophosphoprotein-like [Salvia hispanica]XP_047962906.1 dentin sialophosphoprotein-like [Salvia hispanica]
MTMKETWKETTFDSRFLGGETDALTVESKERYALNDSRVDASITELEAKDRDNCSNFKVADDSFVDDENGTLASPWKEGQNGLSHHLVTDKGTINFPTKESKDGQARNGSSLDKDADSLSSDSCDMDNEQGSPDRKSFDTVEELADCNGRDSRDSSSLLFTDKNVLECDLPVSEVCYREIGCQMLKDICVDEGRSEKDSNEIESSMPPLPPNDNVDLETKEDPSMDANRITGNQCGSKDENDRVKFISQEKLDSYLENEVEASEACFDGASKAENNSSNGSLADRKLPNETFGYLPDQVLDQEAVPECPAASSAEAEGTRKDVQASCLAYNRKVENGTIIFHFNSPDGVVVGNNVAEDFTEQSAELGDMHKDLNAGDLPAAVEAKVQFTSNGDDSLQHSLVSNEGNSDSGTATNEGSLSHKQEDSDDIPLDDGPVQSPSSKSPVATNDSQAANAPNHDKKDSGDVPVTNQLQHDMGETSFSAASMIAYSGPIAFSGSLSHRSDGSTTSGKSFAFPVLQSEWNSSPVRMAKADRTRFRKHKGWRSGLLCCRF